MTSTNVSRLILAHPDLGSAGGAPLHASITAMYKKLGDNMSSRMLIALNVTAPGGVATLNHDFRDAFADMRWDLYLVASTDPYDFTRITATSSPSLSQFTVAANGTNPTTQIDVTNNSGSTRNLCLVVHMDPLNLSEGDIKDIDVVTIPPQDGQAMVFDATSSKWKPGASGDASFKLQAVSTPTLSLKGGSIIDGDDEYATYDGSGGASTDYGTDLALNLTTIFGGAPANATTYHLFIDKYTLSTEQTLSDNGRLVYAVQQANFVLSTSRHRDTNRYVYIGSIKSATTGTVWSGTGSAFFTEPFRRHDRMSRFFSYPEVLPTTAITSATATNTINHGFSGKPQQVLVTYFDGTNEFPTDQQTTVKNITATQIIVNSLGFTFGGGQEIRVYALRYPTQSQIASPATTKSSAWFTSTATTTFAHGMDLEDIKGYTLEEFNVSTGKYKIVPPDLVTNFDQTNFNLNWTGYSPSATLQYRVNYGSSPVANSLPLVFSGYTKFVGAGPGSYASLTLALAASAAGDSILVARDTTETADLSIPAGVRIDQMPGTTVNLSGSLTNGVRFTGAKGSWKNMNVKLSPTGTEARGISIEAADCWVDGWVELATAQTLTAALLVTSGGVRAKASLGVLKTLGTITALEDNQDGAGSTSIWGG